MRKIKNHKVAIVNEFSEKISLGKGMAVLQNNGMLLSEMNEFRKKARMNGIEVKVVKNSLFKIGLEQVEDTIEKLKGNIVVLIADTAIDALGFCSEFSKEEKKLLEPIMIVDKKGAINDKNKVKSLVQARSFQGLITSLIMVLKTPSIKLVKILDLAKDQR